MWRFCVVIVLAAVAVSVAAATPLTTEDKVRTLAEGCATTTLNGCDLVARGVIGSGDCTFTNGTRYDRYEITVPPGKQVAFTLRALDSSYTTPALVVVPPSGEPQTPPAVYGNRAATVWIQTFTTGTWVIAATTLDLFASGRYALHVDCFDGTNPRHDCVAQELLCGQTGEGTLTAESCSFSSVPRAYVNWTIYGVEGDVLTITETSTAFS
ncbi:MAG TPA: hypothetical protein VJZ00_05035, partial [Thermoanaerobaculia bacterium]|nr:hypothetical protein [Thermoanaerobaculia bacterium]